MKKKNFPFLAFVLWISASSFTGVSSARFEENKGQVRGTDAGRVNYVYRNGNLSVFLLETGLAYQFTRVHEPEGLSSSGLGCGECRTATYRMDIRFEGADPKALITAEGKDDGYTNYYPQGIEGVHSYSKITYHNLYPFIDWVIYSNAGGLKYDFVLHPGADPASIRLSGEFVEHTRFNADGSVTFQNRLGTITEQAPESHQNNRPVESYFRQWNDGLIGFGLGTYDPSQTLVIDPSIQWATYFGGSGSDGGKSCRVDQAGNVYITGFTSSSANIAAGGYQTTYGAGDLDAFVVKFNAAGTRQWATYYGGAGNDFASACAVDADGNVYVAGETTQASTAMATPGSFQSTYGGGLQDAFLVKFNASGQRQWATYYGGDNIDMGYACAVDASGNVFLGGTTGSLTGIASGGFQTDNGGTVDAFLVKFNAAGQRQWSSYYGGTAIENGSTCTTDADGNVYFGGTTNSTSFIASPGSHQTAFGGVNDAFLVKFNASGQRQWATYYGGNGYEQAFSCVTDPSGNIYMAGGTASSSGVASGGFQNTFGTGANDAFLVKFNPGGSRQWGTYYGGTGDDYAISCSVDGGGHVYLSGQTSSVTGIASDGFQNSPGGGNDAFWASFDASGTRRWGSYYGGSGDEGGNYCMLDGAGNIFLTGSTSSTDNIATSGSFQSAYGGGSLDAFVIKVSEDFLSVSETGTEKISVFPNPVSEGQFTLETTETGTYCLVDLTGKTLQTGTVKPGKNTVNVLGLAAGTYVLKLGTYTQKIVLR